MKTKNEIWDNIPEQKAPKCLGNEGQQSYEACEFCDFIEECNKKRR